MDLPHIVVKDHPVEGTSVTIDGAEIKSIVKLAYIHEADKLALLSCIGQ